MFVLRLYAFFKGGNEETVSVVPDSFVASADKTANRSIKSFSIAALRLFRNGFSPSSFRVRSKKMAFTSEKAS
jgi:hypothetical protein